MADKITKDNILNAHVLFDEREGGTSQVFVPLNKSVGEQYDDFVAMWFFRRNKITADNLTKLYITRKKKAREKWNLFVSERNSDEFKQMDFFNALQIGCFSELGTNDPDQLAEIMFSAMKKAVGRFSNDQAGTPTDSSNPPLIR